MTYTILFIAGLLLLGVGALIFARPLAIWEYKFDSRWKMTFGLGVNFRVWYFRIAGIVMIGISLFALVESWALQFI